MSPRITDWRPLRTHIRTRPASVGSAAEGSGAALTAVAALLLFGGTILSLQPVTKVDGPGLLYTGAVVTFTGAALAYRSPWWVKTLAALIAALCTIDTVIVSIALTR